MFGKMGVSWVNFEEAYAICAKVLFDDFFFNVILFCKWLDFVCLSTIFCVIAKLKVFTSKGCLMFGLDFSKWQIPLLWGAISFFC